MGLAKGVQAAWDANSPGGGGGFEPQLFTEDPKTDEDALSRPCLACGDKGK